MPTGSISRSSYSRYRRASTAARARTVSAARGAKSVTFVRGQTTRNAPVRRALRKPRRVGRVARNKGAILTLARQVKSLQNRQYGEMQRHTMGLLASDSGALPSGGQPIAFMVSSFYEDAIYKGVITGGIATFARSSTAFAQSTFQSDLNDEFEWNANNQDTVSLSEYKPVFTRLNFHFKFLFQNVSDGGDLRITLLTIRDYNYSNKLSLNLPTSLGAYRNLCWPQYNINKNYFNSRYHKIIYDRTWHFRNKNDASGQSCQFEKDISIPVRYGNMVLRPDFTNHPSGQEFWTNVPKNKIIWCLVSTSPGLDGKMVNMGIGRYDSWRDAHGSAAS